MDLSPLARNAVTVAISTSAALSSRFRSLTGLLTLLPGLAFAEPPSIPSPAAGELCLPAIAAAERDGKLPAHLLRSIAFVESGRTDPATGRTVPWPWTINVAGRGYFYDSKEEVITAVRGFQARGIRSIDVGCAQVNLMHHPSAFASLEEAFEPRTNTSYAARFLNSLYATTRSWPMAAAGYHSQTPNLGFGYARKVMAIWPGSARYGALPEPGRGPASRPAMDFSIYTPEFAAVSRRIDEDLMRGARRSRIVTDLQWINRPSEPVRLLPQGSRRVARRDLRQDPG